MDLLTWRGNFYTRVPLGIIALVMAWLSLKAESLRRQSQILSLGRPLLGGLSCLLLSFNLGENYSFISPPTLGLLVSALVLLIPFVRQERRAAHPVMYLSLFNNSVFTLGNMGLGVLSIGVAAQLFLMPFYLLDAGGHVHQSTALPSFRS